MSVLINRCQKDLFADVFKISVLKILPKSTGKQTRKETPERDSNTGVFLWIFEIFENIFFTEHLRKTASLMY